MENVDCRGEGGGGEEEEEEEEEKKKKKKKKRRKRKSRRAANIVTSRCQFNIRHTYISRQPLRFSQFHQNTLSAAVQFSLASLTDDTHNDITKSLPICTGAATVTAKYQVLRYSSCVQCESLFPSVLACCHF
jgi:methylase of polypeptide subunit release factors